MKPAPLYSQKEETVLTTIVGVDPGIVHTGLVAVTFNPSQNHIVRYCHVVDGLDMFAVADWVRDFELRPSDAVFVEKYRPRLKLSSDPVMMDAERELKDHLPKAKLVDNMGIKKMLTIQLMKVLGLWDFPLTTHHQDLRSASRILVRGMLQETRTNTLVADVVQDHLLYKPWDLGVWNV